MSDDSSRSSAARRENELDDLVVQYLDRLDEGVELDIDAFCAAHPEFAGELRVRLLALQRTGLLREGGARDDGPTPERLGEFKLLARLGGGGMGIVYLAQQTTLDRRVALKLIRPEQLFFPGARERFRREVEAVAALAHPGIVPVYSFGEDNGVPFFAMEHVAGATLGAVVESLAARAPQSLSGRDLARALGELAQVEFDSAAPVFRSNWIDASLRIVEQIAAALQHAHERGVLHRDIKPSNVMLTPDGRARLVDFGLATRQGAERLTRTGSQLGSLPYLSPEQASGAGGVATVSWDIYALGVVLYELLTLRLPYSSDSATGLMQRIVEGRATSPRRINPSIPVDVETVCMVAMDPDPARRYASARAFADDVARVLDKRPIAARPVSAALRARRWAQRNPARAVAVALAAAVVVGGPIAYAWVEHDARGKVESANLELKKSNDALTDAQREIERKNQDLQRALGRAEEQRARAEGHFDRAFQAVDEMLNDVGADELEDQPELQPVRKKLLDKALVFYGQLLDDKPGDFDVRREQARVGRAMGDVYQSLGKTDEAEALYRKQVASLRELRDQDPNDAEHRYALASVQSQLASILLVSNRNPEAQSLLEEARVELTALSERPDAKAGYERDLIIVLHNLGLIARSEGRIEDALELMGQGVTRGVRRVAADPESNDYRACLASVSSVRAALLQYTGKDDEARAEFQRCFETQEELLRAEPHSRRHARELIETCGNYGLLLGRMGDEKLAQETLEHGRDVAVQLVHDYPDEPRDQINLAGLCINLGVQVGSHGHPDDAEKAFELARDTMQKLVDKDPAVVEHHFFLATALQNLAGLELERGRLETAMPYIERSLAQFDEALAAAPKHPAILSQKCFTMLALADALRQQGHVADAARKAEEVTQYGSMRSDLFVNQAEVFAMCVEDVRKDAALDAGERERLLQTYSERAFAALRSALQGQFGDLGYLRSAPHLAILREDPRFESALAEFAAQKQ